MTSRPGLTLVELLITLTLLGVLASVTTLAIRGVERPTPSSPPIVLADSVGRSIRERRRVNLEMSVAGQAVHATVSPSGRIVADSQFHVVPPGARILDAR